MDDYISFGVKMAQTLKQYCDLIDDDQHEKNKLKKQLSIKRRKVIKIKNETKLLGTETEIRKP